jgi:hypothetical protein
MCLEFEIRLLERETRSTKSLSLSLVVLGYQYCLPASRNIKEKEK